MESILDAVQVPTYVFDPDEGIVWGSSAARNLFGESLPSLADWELGTTSDVASLSSHFEAADGEPVQIWIESLDGVFPFEVTANPHGERIILTLTPMLHTEVADTPTGHAADLFMHVSIDGTILFSSGPCMGKPREVIEGEVFFGLLPEKWSGPLRRRFERLEGDRRGWVDTSRVDYDGDVREVISRVRPVIRDGQITGAFYEMWDTTADRDATEVLRLSENMYRQAIENSLDLVAIFTMRDLAIRFVSPNCEEILGHPMHDVLERSFLDFIDPDDRERVTKKVAMIGATEDASSVIEARVVKADGSSMLVEARGRVLSDDGDEKRVIVNARDITARHESQMLRRSLIRADKLAAIGQVAASVAHEVNNPASFITTNLHVMQEDLEFVRDVVDASAATSEVERAQTAIGEIEEMLKTNLEGMHRISRIVKELKVFSRSDDEKLELIRVGEVAEAACNMVRNQLSYLAEIVEDYEEELPAVFADRGRISQVLVNLLVNAFQAIELAERNTPHQVVVSVYVEDGSDVRIDISDTGPGVPADVQRQIFDPFFTTKDRDDGTGLGLWLAREIVEKCGGRIWLDDTSSTGSCFSMTLPAQSLMPIPETSFEEISSSASDDVPSARVLLVDDDEFVLDAYSKILAHHDIETAQGGDAAIDILARDSAWDVVVCDIMMPDVDGCDVYEHVCSEHPHLIDRTFFCTAGVFTERTRAFVATVRDRVVHKPISARSLRGIVASIAVAK